MTYDDYRALCLAAERGDRKAEAIVNKPHHTRTDSPIERRLVDALLERASYKDVPEVWEEGHRGVLLGVDPAYMFELETQVKVGPYRVDIMLTRRNTILVVECDGYAYHSTPEQMARDAKRDRYLIGRGMYVLRFTGSDIHWNAYHLAGRTLETAQYLADGDEEN